MQQIDEALKIHLRCGKIFSKKTLGGGANTQSFLYETEKQSYFIKYDVSLDVEYFAAEAKGLKLLSQLGFIRVPKAYYYGQIASKGSFLVLEYIQSESSEIRDSSLFGRSLARMHLAGGSQGFGFFKDNMLGKTLQRNKWTKDWLHFLKRYRLYPMVTDVYNYTKDIEVKEKGEKLLDQLSIFFENISVDPSFLHGDLWKGNVGTMRDGSPFIYDPAAYFGHHEAELSIMRIFGGFSEEVFLGYHELIPKAQGFEKRQIIYELYHYLNHYLIFGDSYRAKCIECLDTLLVHC